MNQLELKHFDGDHGSSRQCVSHIPFCQVSSSLYSVQTYDRTSTLHLTGRTNTTLPISLSLCPGSASVQPFSCSCWRLGDVWLSC